MPIHPTAIVDPSARIAETAEIGPYCIIGADVEIARRHAPDGQRLRGRPHLDRRGQHFLSIQHRRRGLAGSEVQGREFRNQDRHRNRIREFVTIHRGTEGGGMVTRIGDDNLLMAYVHVAHDAQMGNGTVLGHGATLGGHVTVGDWAECRRLFRRAPVLPGGSKCDRRAATA